MNAALCSSDLCFGQLLPVSMDYLAHLATLHTLHTVEVDTLTPVTSKIFPQTSRRYIAGVYCWILTNQSNDINLM